MLFSVLNIITGVFVDGAVEMAKRDRQLMVEKQAKAREAYAVHWLHLLQDMDRSGDGVISEAEFLASMERQDVTEFLEALNIGTDDAANIFTLLDRNGDGLVD